MHGVGLSLYMHKSKGIEGINGRLYRTKINDKALFQYEFQNTQDWIFCILSINKYALYFTSIDSNTWMFKLK